MGSPSAIEIVTGEAKIRRGDISTADWCGILKVALRVVKRCLKNVSSSDFMPLAKLLNGPFLFYGPLATPEKALPDLKGVGLKPCAKFIALQRLKSSEDSADGKAKHEQNWRVLLLTDSANFAILELVLFKQEDRYIVCSSSLIAHSTVRGYKSLLDTDAPEIRDRIEDGSICPYGILDHLSLALGRTVSDQEKRLEETREARDTLEGMRDRTIS
jgi:hypothetical protein